MKDAQEIQNLLQKGVKELQSMKVRSRDGMWWAWCRYHGGSKNLSWTSGCWGYGKWEIQGERLIHHHRGKLWSANSSNWIVWWWKVGNR